MLKHGGDTFLSFKILEEPMLVQKQTVKPSLSSQWSLVQKLRMRFLLHQFCMTLLSERGESNKTNANKVSSEAWYETSFASVLYDFALRER